RRPITTRFARPRFSLRSFFVGEGSFCLEKQVKDKKLPSLSEKSFFGGRRSNLTGRLRGAEVSVMTRRLNMEKNKPINTIRVGRLQAAIWRRESSDAQAAPRFSVSFSRVYKDKDGNFQDSDYYFQSDILNLIKLAAQVHTFMLQQNFQQHPPNEE